LRLALALGMTVKRLLRECDSEELAEWHAFHELYPLPDPWVQTARLCRTIMAASGNYKRLPEESVFIPASKKPKQSQEQMFAELMKLQQPPQG
jgi:hypothetical protein